MYVLFFKSHIKYVVVRSEVDIDAGLCKNKMSMDMTVGAACNMETLDQNMRMAGSCIPASSVQGWEVLFNILPGMSSYMSKEELEMRMSVYQTWYTTGACCHRCNGLIK